MVEKNTTSYIKVPNLHICLTLKQKPSGLFIEYVVRVNDKQYEATLELDHVVYLLINADQSKEGS